MRLQKFDKETGSEDADEKDSAQRSRFEFCSPASPHRVQEHESRQIDHRFIKLHGVAWSRRCAVGGMAENNSPGDRCQVSQYFLVKEIGESDESDSDGSRNDEEVH